MPRDRFPEPCMCGDPECGICGPLQGYDYTEEEQQLEEELRVKNMLVLDLGMMIRHIDKHASFDKRDLISLLKRSKTFIHNTPIGN